MGQDNSTPNSEGSQYIRFYNLLHFCDEHDSDLEKIREISHYKETNHPEHEFLLVKVVAPSSQSSRWLRLDRGRQEKATSLPNLSSSIFPANDTVRVAAQATLLLQPPSSRMSSLQYDAPSEPSLADLRCLLRLVSEMSPQYKLWQEQCYWFCDSIMVIMKEQFPTELVLEAAHSRRGTFKKIVHMPSNTTVRTNIQRAFKSNLASNVNLLRTHSNHPPPMTPPRYQPQNSAGDREAMAGSYSHRQSGQLQTSQSFPGPPPAPPHGPPYWHQSGPPPIPSGTYLGSASPFGYPSPPMDPPQPPPYHELQGSQQPFFQYSQSTGKKKALCIGINYFRQEEALKGCINDARNIERFLCERFGYKRNDIVVLTDDQQNPRSIPTRDTILRAMQWLVHDAQPNDSLFFHYSGHGGQTEDLDGDEADGLVEVIYPLDFKKAGYIADDYMHDIMVKPLPSGCRLTAIFDSGHSGSALDLPYIYSTEGKIKEPNAGQAKVRATKTSPADVMSWSGCKDSQTSADGSATGAMSYAIITALTQQPRQSYQQLLVSLRGILRARYSQKPQLSSSHPMDTNLEFIA